MIIFPGYKKSLFSLPDNITEFFFTRNLGKKIIYQVNQARQ